MNKNSKKYIIKRNIISNQLCKNIIKMYLFMIYKLLTVSQGVRHFYPKMLKMHINTSVKMQWKLHGWKREKKNGMFCD